MCGIAGYIHRSHCTEICTQIEFLAHETQACRGPDSSKSWRKSEEAYTVHLFHQRLRIQDLSPQADQPMHSKNSQGLHIVYNGEIYNPNEIKNEFIPDVALRTHSDTEILTEVLAVDDPCKVLNAVRGMFAIGSYNSGLESLDLIRDYFGEKPLHYTFGNDYIIFASQFDTVAQSLKTMGYSLEVNQESIYKYLILGYFPFGSSLYNNVYKVHPGSLVRFNLKAGTSFTPEQHYWTSPWKTSAPVDKPINVLENFLSAAVFEQLISDVPVGVFLSGGVDSTLVSALAKKFSKNPIHSFSLGFSEADFDESTYALKASRELGTQHHALQMTSANALEILPEVLRAFPEPLGDPSVFPTTFISREAKKTVTVVLTGDGADELFFGYGRYTRFLKIRALKESHSLLVRILQLFFQASVRNSKVLSGRIKRISRAISRSSDVDLYLSLVAFPHYNPATNKNLFESVLVDLKNELTTSSNIKRPEQEMREMDVRTYLVDNILVKVDRAAMAFGLETRAPFLDRRVADLAASASLTWINNGEQKHALKEILAQFVSEEIFRRKKMGFGAPMGVWLRTTLKPWGEELVYSFSWESLGINSKFVYDLWEGNLRSQEKSATYLWMLLSLAHSVKRFS